VFEHPEYETGVVSTHDTQCLSILNMKQEWYLLMTHSV
jgi:hypothetical protein